MRLSRLYLWANAAATAGGLIVLALLFFGWQLTAVEEEALASAFVVFTCCVVGFGCAMAYENGRAPRLMRSGMIAGLVALAGWLVYLWVPQAKWEYHVARIVIWPTVWACLMMLVGVLLWPRRTSAAFRLLRVSSLLLLSLLALEVAVAVALYPLRGGTMSVHEYEDIAFKLGGSLSLLAGGCLALTLLALVLRGRDEGGQRAQGAAEYWLECPRCGAAQDARTGVHKCVACGLRTTVELS